MVWTIIKTGSLLAFSFTSCLRTLLIEDSASLGPARNDKAYFNGDKNNYLTIWPHGTHHQISRIR